MIYLIGKIFIYLLIALGIGAAAGWLWRNLQAVDRESALERALMELRRRLPQIEMALRKRDEQLDAAHAELRAREEALSHQAELAAERDRLTEELERMRAQPAPAADARELAEARETVERLNKALQAEQRRVEELSRERELQNRALVALEQQLDMARDGHDKVVNG